MYQKRDDVDVYHIRNYKYPLGSSGKNTAADVDVIQHRLGAPRLQADYDPVGGFRGLEWTFEDTRGEPYMFFQQYGVWYASNRDGGIELAQFRDWILSFLTREPAPEADPMTLKAQECTPLVEATVSTTAYEDEDCAYETYAEDYVRSLY